MEIIIHDNRVIEEIQKEFSEKYPNLWVEFFIYPGPKGYVPDKKLMVHPKKKIKECRVIHGRGTLTILPEMTIRQVEKGFKDQFGLHTKIFHRVGSDWLEPSTRHWSLEKQNITTFESNSENTLERV